MHATFHMQKVYSFLQVPKNDLFQVLFLKKPNTNFMSVLDVRTALA